MDDTRCRHFFQEPAQTYQRQYEALRSVFVERRCIKDVAEQFGYQYGSLRTIAYRFRTQLDSDEVPPFLPSLV